MENRKIAELLAIANAPAQHAMEMEHLNMFKEPVHKCKCHKRGIRGNVMELIGAITVFGMLYAFSILLMCI